MLGIGFWAASASGGGAGVPAYELISTSILGSTTESVTFSSIPQTYKHLQIRWTGRNNESWGSTGLASGYWFRINGSTASSYSGHSLEGNGSSVGTTSYSALSYVRLVTSLANSFSPASAYTGGITDFVDYTNANTNKTLRSLAGYVSNTTEKGGVTFASGALHSTGAITSITIGAGAGGPGAGGNFVSGSRFSLYGVK